MSIYLNDALQFTNPDEDIHIWYRGWCLGFHLHVCLLLKTEKYLMFKFNLQIINHLSRFFIESGEEITAKDALILDNHYQQVTLSGG